MVSETNFTTLKELADYAKKNGTTYWKFTRTKWQRGRDGNKGIQYIPGKIACAEDSEKFLSFFEGKNAARYFAYGDILTQFSFDLTDTKFEEIQDYGIRYFDGGREMDCLKLLPLRNYSFADVRTVKLFLELLPKDESLLALAVTPFFTQGVYWQWLLDQGHEQSAEAFRRISAAVYPKNEIQAGEALLIYEDYYKELQEDGVI